MLNTVIQPASINIDEWHLPQASADHTTLSVLRLDKIHPLISGNNWFKLRFYLEDAKSSGKEYIVTRAGAWSNHILATAAADQHFGFKSSGLIRGEEPVNGSYTLDRSRELGMEMVFQSRSDYQAKELPEKFTASNYYYIPEGGYGQLGAEGAATILDHC